MNRDLKLFGSEEQGSSAINLKGVVVGERNIVECENFRHCFINCGE